MDGASATHPWRDRPKVSDDYADLQSAIHSPIPPPPEVGFQELLRRARQKTNDAAKESELAKKNQRSSSKKPRNKDSKAA
jgi:hypothetical protein